jgi:hypothetical protein
LTKVGRFVLSVVVITLVLPLITASGQGVPGVAKSAWRSGGLQINQAIIDPGAPVDIRPVQADNNLLSLQPVSRMCAGCLLAVNADYYHLDSHEPDGGNITDGTVIRSPNLWQNQLTFKPDGHLAAGIMQFTGKLTSSDNTTISIAVNVDHSADQSIIYDRHFGVHTPADPGAFELALAEDPAGLALSRPLAFNILGPHAPGQPVPPGQVVLSGTGAAAASISGLWTRVHAGAVKTATTLVMTTDPPARHSLGANLVLVKDGQLQPITVRSNFDDGPNPRTIAGWDNAGRVYFMTIGGTRLGHRTGVSLAQAGQTMKALGATNAINLDDGGSTTFVSDGTVVNHPSDGLERPVDSAWVVTAKPGVLAALAAARVAAQSHAAPIVAKPVAKAPPVAVVAPTTSSTTTSLPVASTIPPTTAPTPSTTVEQTAALVSTRTSDGSPWTTGFLRLTALLGVAALLIACLRSMFRGSSPG